MAYCYNCFRELTRTGDPCPRCGWDPALEEGTHSWDLPYGSVLAGRYITGRARGGTLARSYEALDWKEKRRALVWEFYPDRHANRQKGSPQVTYHKNGLAPDTPENDPAYWLDRFYDLSGLLADLRMPGREGREHFPQWWGFFEENNTAYFVTERVEGETLEAYLESRGGSVTWLEAMGLLAPAARALECVHREGAVHGGLSPDRIILTRDGGLKLLDPGVVALDDSYLIQTVDDACPTRWSPYHMATVLYTGLALDVYSLASCFYRAVAGEPPEGPKALVEQETLPVPEGRFPATMEKVLLEVLQFRLEPVLAGEHAQIMDFWRALERAACG